MLSISVLVLSASYSKSVKCSKSFCINTARSGVLSIKLHCPVSVESKHNEPLTVDLFLCGCNLVLDAVFLVDGVRPRETITDCFNKMFIDEPFRTSVTPVQIF